MKNRTEATRMLKTAASVRLLQIADGFSVTLDSLMREDLDGIAWQSAQLAV